MCRICVVGTDIDIDNEEHMCHTREFEYYQDTMVPIKHALEFITGAPLFCVPKVIIVKKDDSQAK